MGEQNVSKPIVVFADSGGILHELEIQALNINVGCDDAPITPEEYSFTINTPKLWKFWKWRDLYRYRRFLRRIKDIQLIGILKQKEVE